MNFAASSIKGVPNCFQEISDFHNTGGYLEVFSRTGRHIKTQRAGSGQAAAAADGDDGAQVAPVLRQLRAELLHDRPVPVDLPGAPKSVRKATA